MNPELLFLDYTAMLYSAGVLTEVEYRRIVGAIKRLPPGTPAGEYHAEIWATLSDEEAANG